MTDKEYRERQIEDKVIISRLCPEVRGAIIRHVNDLLIGWRRTFKQPRETSPLVHWNPITSSIDWTTMAEASEHYKKKHNITGKPKKNYNHLFQSSDVQLGTHMAKINAFADKCGLRVKVADNNGFVMEAPNRQAFDRFFALCESMLNK